MAQSVKNLKIYPIRSFLGAVSSKEINIAEKGKLIGMDINEIIKNIAKK